MKKKLDLTKNLPTPNNEDWKLNYLDHTEYRNSDIFELVYTTVKSKFRIIVHISQDSTPYQKEERVLTGAFCLLTDVHPDRYPDTTESWVKFYNKYSRIKK